MQVHICKRASRTHFVRACAYAAADVCEHTNLQTGKKSTHWLAQVDRLAQVERILTPKAKSGFGFPTRPMPNCTRPKLSGDQVIQIHTNFKGVLPAVRTNPPSIQGIGVADVVVILQRLHQTEQLRTHIVIRECDYTNVIIPQTCIRQSNYNRDWAFHERPAISDMLRMRSVSESESGAPVNGAENTSGTTTSAAISHAL